MQVMGEGPRQGASEAEGASAAQRLEQARAFDDAARLQLLEDLYAEFEQELDRDLGEAPSPRH
jgi:hypothetical protein